MKKKCLLVCLLCCLLLGLALAEEPMTETVLFEGSQHASGGWNLALTIDTTNVNGTFDPSLISENGYFLDYHIKCNTAPKKERHCVRFVLE